MADQRIGGASLYDRRGHVSDLGCPSGVDWFRNRSFNPDSGTRESVTVLDNDIGEKICLCPVPTDSIGEACNH